MKNLARGSVALALVALVVTLFYFQAKVEAALVIANDSQNNLQLNIQDKQDKSINKTDNKTELKPEIDDSIEINPDSTGEKTTAVSYRATAYCLQGKTASGKSVRRGIIAADTRVLPLGTQVSINAGSWSGDYVVADTGGAVKGKKIDVWVPSCSEAKRFGSRTIKLHVKRRR